LLEYASRLRNSTKCRLLPDIGMGYNNMVRVIEFDDGQRWAARVCMSSISINGRTIELLWYVANQSIDEEVVFLSLIRKSSNIPPPRFTRTRPPIPRESMFLSLSWSA
jgi:hypothetical protein